MPVTSSALATREPETNDDDVRWAFRLMARWLGDANENAAHITTRLHLGAAEKIARLKTGFGA